jgi:ferredoxin
MTRKTLRSFAQGKPCMVRIAGVCNHDPETTVLAHIRRGGVAGMGQKPPDTCGVWACSSCHDAIDKRDGKCSDSDLLEAMCRQLAFYDKHEILTVCL